MNPSHALIIRTLESGCVDTSRHIIPIYQDRFCAHPCCADGSTKASGPSPDDDDIGLCGHRYFFRPYFSLIPGGPVSRLTHAA